MANATREMDKLIGQSRDRREIAHAPHEAELAAELELYSDDWTENGDVVEYWADDWRVHLVIGGAVS